jgi:hypothetical protein
VDRIDPRRRGPCRRGLLGLSENPALVLLFLNAMLLVAGMLLDAISIYYVFVPLLLPVMKQFGWDPIWFGVMMSLDLAIGTVTPPVAVNLYVAGRLADVEVEEVARCGPVHRRPRGGLAAGGRHPRALPLAARPARHTVASTPTLYSTRRARRSPGSSPGRPGAW